MATYPEIQTHIKQQHQITIKTCWIADVKRKCGLTNRVAHNRIDPNKAKYPCPPKIWYVIEDALRHFGDIK